MSSHWDNMGLSESEIKLMKEQLVDLNMNKLSDKRYQRSEKRSFNGKKVGKERP